LHKEEKGGHANSKTEDIDDAEYPVFEQASVCNTQVVSEHDDQFTNLIGEKGAMMTIVGNQLNFPF